MTEDLPAGASEESEDFAALLEENIKGQFARFEPGQMVEASIVRTTDEWVFIDVGRKSEGYVDRKELLDASGELKVKDGDRIRAYYMPGGKGAEMRFTTRIGHGPAGDAQLQDAQKNGIPVQGTVQKEVKGGFEVRIGEGVRAFCPHSLMGLRRDENPAEQVGKSCTFKITECKDRNVVVSRKAILDVERREKAQALKSSLKEGMRVNGTVVSIQKFGAFVDLGGVQGLVPVSEIAWTRTEEVGDALSVGQAVEVVIKRLDWEHDKVSLSLKDALPDPWDRAAERWPEGTYLTGKVTRLAAFGAFVALGEGVEGLLHISKLGGERRIGHPREVIKQGETVEVRVDSVDRAGRKISLSLAAISREQEETEAALKEYREKAEAHGEGLGSLGSLLGHTKDEEE
jgi:small subunit ribosomal protein S1